MMLRYISIIITIFLASNLPCWMLEILFYNHHHFSGMQSSVECFSLFQFIVQFSKEYDVQFLQHLDPYIWGKQIKKTPTRNCLYLADVSENFHISGEFYKKIGTLKVTYPKYAVLAPSTNMIVDSLSRSMTTRSITFPGAVKY